MKLSETLAVAIDNGRQLAHNIATTKFGDDSPEHREIDRRLTAVETAGLLGISPQALRKAEQAGRLPPPDMTTDSRDRPRRMGYTFRQIDAMRDVFNARPGREDADDMTLVISVCGHKGGSWKTSTSVHLAQRYSMLGYKVLLVDMDPQATASLYHGYVADVNTHEADTALPFLLGEAGDLSGCVHPTCWPGLDIIPGCLGLHRIETELEQRYADGIIDIEPHLMLREGLETIFDAYDLVIVDGSPNLGMGTVNMVCAADIILAPTPAELNDYLSTTQFFEGLRALLDGVDLGGFEPDLRVLITKYSHQVGSASSWMAEQIRDTWGGLVLANMVSITEEVGKGQVRMRTIYEQSNQERSTPSAWKKAQDIWNPVADELQAAAIWPRWPSKQEAIQ